jgi:FkbM family methyltransferase
LPPEDLVHFLPGHYLSSFSQYLVNGYDALLYWDLPLDASDAVLVIGAYHGDGVSEYLKRYNCRVIACEPVSFFFNELENRLGNDSRVECFEIALGSTNELITIPLEADASGIFANSKERIVVEKLDILYFLDHHKLNPTVIEINIEGGEYELLQRLVRTPQISKVDTLLVQFHKNFPGYELERAKIRSALAETHVEVFNFEYVWERWDLIGSNTDAK